MTDWFAVDKTGLAKLLERKGKAFVVFELIQNAWDTDAKKVEVRFQPVPGRAMATLFISDDDPNGFSDLDHSFTLFAESGKKADPTKRGRFNLGEKLVLALCERAEIISTKGSVYFTQEGRSTSKKKLKAGSCFYGTLRMTRAEYDEVVKDVQMLLCPPDVETTFNEEKLPSRTPLSIFQVALPTEAADEEGYLKKTIRKTMVRVYERKQGEPARLYEMGIPVVDLPDDPWTIEVMQKIPLNTDRDNVTPAYLRELRVAVLNHMHADLKTEEATSLAVRDALGDDRITPEAVKTVLTHTYGENRVTYDPSDKEANHNAVAHGHTVIPGAAFSKPQWEQIRKAGAALPAGQVFKTPKPYSDDPNAPKAEVIPPDQWTAGMKALYVYTSVLAFRLMNVAISVRFENRPQGSDVANYGHRALCFNVGRLGQAWFDQGPSEAVHDLLLHEFGHEFASSHLDAKYHEALTRLGAKLCTLARVEPGFFDSYGK